MYSGGEESVLVFWQVDTEHKQFKPRLGAPISHICNSQDDTVIAVCHSDNGENVLLGTPCAVYILSKWKSLLKSPENSKATCYECSIRKICTTSIKSIISSKNKSA